MTTTALTVQVLDRMAEDDRYLGFGYLGERRNLRLSVASGERPGTDTALLEATDQRVIDAANERGWDYDQLFEWANSKSGRWFADSIFGGSPNRFDTAVQTAVDLYFQEPQDA